MLICLLMMTKKNDRKMYDFVEEEGALLFKGLSFE